MITDIQATEVILESFNLMKMRVIHACLAKWDEHEMCLPEHVREEFKDTWLELVSRN